MEKELHLGIMTRDELAEWSGLTVAYIKKQKTKWCSNKLSKYAKFNMVRNGVEITEIIEPVYSNKPKLQVQKKFYDNFGGKDPHFKADTCMNAAKKIQEQLSPPDLISFNTTYSYTCEVKREGWGVPKIKSGKLGESQWVYCKIGPNGEGVPFTDEENEIRCQLIVKYVKGDAKKIQDIIAADDALNKKEITLEEYNQITSEIARRECGWDIFQKKFQEAIKCRCGFRTQLIDDGVKWHEDKQNTNSMPFNF